MEKQKVEMFLAQNAKFLPQAKIQQLKDVLSKIDDEKFVYLQGITMKDPTTVLLFSIFLGAYGVDRFMLGDAGMGVLKLLTCGGCYIWWIIDAINAQDKTRNFNYQNLVKTLSMQGVTGLY